MDRAAQIELINAGERLLIVLLICGALAVMYRWRVV